MRTGAIFCVLAVVLLSAAAVASAQECNDASSCGDYILSRNFNGLNCPTTAGENVTYDRAISAANASTCMEGSNGLYTQTVCDRVKKQITFSYFTGSNCAANTLSTRVSYLTSQCMNVAEGSSSSQVFYCSFNDTTTPFRGTVSRALETVSQVPTTATCELNTTSVTSSCTRYAYYREFSGDSCSGTPTFHAASSLKNAAPALDICYYQLQTDRSINYKIACSGSTVTETRFSYGCNAANATSAYTYPTGICISNFPGAQGTSRIYTCPGSAASTFIYSSMLGLILLITMAVLAL